ncbi:YtxH domain-containing protein [Streptomyces sp. 15-116A]|uniref:YtxH domain-containing protein n=1 Tax=Streptomyces sp. 15-116A TaxID=2259035 RepID=UPI0021B3F962|nr:YtxH domain-containing protein [Streptomyces sp. 15-116A]MCT7353530.1 YtxH domain-containing protein [Streptomyces sp. 15-116A]
MRYRLTFVAGVVLGYVLGTRAGRERYEQLKKSAQQLAQNPAVRNTAETAAHQGREFAGKAYHAVSDKVGDHLPDSVAQRVRTLRERTTHGATEDDWGTSNT